MLKATTIAKRSFAASRSVILSRTTAIAATNNVAIGTASFVGRTAELSTTTASHPNRIGSRQQVRFHTSAPSADNDVEKRIQQLGITLPKPAGPRANYDVVCHDPDANVLYVSGHLPFQQDGTLMTGKLTGEEGKDVDYGYQAARHAALNIVATLKERLDGDLSKIEKIQKVFGIVQSSDDFQHQHLVMDGASDVMMEIFGKEVGYHARSAIGTSTLPLDITVEVEAIVKLRPPLRFVVGQKVECKVGPSPEDWAEGTITKLQYMEPEWERPAPYQILLDDGRYIFAPEDTEAVIKAAKQHNQ